MSRRTQIIIQLVLLACHVANGLLPTEGQTKIVGASIIGFLEGGVGIISHAYNTDGTPQTTAFQKTS